MNIMNDKLSELMDMGLDLLGADVLCERILGALDENEALEMMNEILEKAEEDL